MVTKAESRLQRRIRKRITSVYGGWWFKVHGGPFQPAGIPDLVGCVEGIFFGLEVKRPGEEASDIQKLTMRKIKNEGGGYTAIVTTPQEALDVISYALAQAKRSRKTSNKEKNSGTIRRAKNGKNTNSPVSHRAAKVRRVRRADRRSSDE